MKKYRITEEVYYSGRETVIYEVEAESESDAYREAEEMGVTDLLAFWNVEADSDSMKIEELAEEHIRCDKTLDMLVGVQ